LFFLLTPEIPSPRNVGQSSHEARARGNHSLIVLRVYLPKSYPAIGDRSVGPSVGWFFPSATARDGCRYVGWWKEGEW